MPIAIDPALSVYALAARVADSSMMINHRRTMTLISYEIENAVLHDGAKARIFSGFQKMSFFVPQLKRYQQLAERAESIYVFGVPDVPLPDIPNITYVAINPRDQLAREWFLVADAPDYASILATEELTSWDDPDEKRVFKGVWSFDERIVSIVQEWLSSLVDARPLGERKRDPKAQLHYMQRTTMRIANRLIRLSEQRTPQALATAKELELAMPQL
ncbi:MAG: DICT sensory domain-containing protein [Aggregatilineales bacterium]